MTPPRMTQIQSKRKELGAQLRLGTGDGLRGVAVLLIAMCLIVSCAKPGARVSIPEPTQANVWLAWDGTKAVWMPITGGPSGAIDATTHIGEIELVAVAAAAARYLVTPVSYAKDVQAGQLVTYGPATDGQAIQASGMSAKLVGIERGVLIEGKVDQQPQPGGPGRAILGWTGSTNLAAGAKSYVTWGSLGLASDDAIRVFPMPLAGRFTRLVASTRGAQPATGALEFALAKAGVAQALKVIVPAGAAAGVFAADGSVDIAANDVVQVEITNRAQSTSPNFTAVTAVFEVE